SPPPARGGAAPAAPRARPRRPPPPPPRPPPPPPPPPPPAAPAPPPPAPAPPAPPRPATPRAPARAPGAPARGPGRRARPRGRRIRFGRLVLRRLVAQPFGDQARGGAHAPDETGQNEHEHEQGHRAPAPDHPPAGPAPRPGRAVPGCTLSRRPACGSGARRRAARRDHAVTVRRPRLAAEVGAPRTGRSSRVPPITCGLADCWGAEPDRPPP